MITGILLNFIFCAIYFAPTIIAIVRFPKSVDLLKLIAIVNILFGWTLIFWLICLFWALSKTK